MADNGPTSAGAERDNDSTNSNDDSNASSDVSVDKSFEDLCKEVMSSSKEMADYISIDGYHFREKGTKNLFSRQLPECQVPALSNFTFVVRNRMDRFSTVEVNADSFAPITMFAERGFYSGHVYQPDVNHRQMNFSSFFEENHSDNEKRNIPLVHSMLYPSDEQSFSSGNLMSFYCYELDSEATHTKEFAIKSPTALTFEFPHQNDPNGIERFHGMGYIEGYSAKNLTLDTFKRTLEVFGLRRNLRGNKTKGLTVQEVARFLQEIGKYSLTTFPELMEFVKKFKLQRMYEVTEDPLEFQLHQLFSIIRSLTPFRIAAYDGRHRFNLCCYFATGFFHPCTELKLKHSEFGETYRDPLYLKYTAAFKNQTFEVSLADDANDTTRLLQSFKVMQKKGFQATANQELVVLTTWDSILSEFLEQLLENDAIEPLREFNYQTYWEPGGDDFTVVKTNFTVILDAFCAFLKEAPETREKLAIGNLKEGKWDEVEENVRKARDVTNFLGNKRAGKPDTGVPRNLAVILCALKWLCDKIPNMLLLRQYFQVRAPRVLQNDTTGDDSITHKSIDYLRWSVVGIVNIASEFLMQRYIVEKYILDWARRQKQDPTLESDLNDYPNFENCCKLKHFQDNLWKKLDAKLATWSDSEQSLYLTDDSVSTKHQKVTTKLKFALQASMFRDILETMTWFGFNGKLTYSGSKNHALHLYLNNDHVFCTLSIPPISSLRNIKEETRCSTSLLLDLYPDYLKETVNMKDPRITALSPLKPDKGCLNTAKKRTDKGFRARWGNFDDLGNDVQTLDTFFPTEWRFSHFVEGVISGDIDIDSIPRFQTHMASHMKDMRKEYIKHMKACDEDPTLLRTEYTPPHIDAGSKRDAPDTFDSYVKMLKDFHTMDKKGSIKKKYAKMDLTSKHLYDSFEALHQQGYVKSIILDEKKMKEDLSLSNPMENEDITIAHSTLYKAATDEKEKALAETSASISTLKQHAGIKQRAGIKRLGSSKSKEKKNKRPFAQTAAASAPAASLLVAPALANESLESPAFQMKLAATKKGSDEDESFCNDANTNITTASI